ncbi:MAG TPA: calcium/sodium antiporter [Paludibacteraceae bacterium]|nr:calcium/sodium antiporter [Paludibacteraceae bacterium]HQB69028.1 calcium/sodium antiporter [Paludibacteraceae bacterium]HRS67382.1 calcium/sodium antiporter [Paludibacteraceae bacterium]
MVLFFALLILGFVVLILGADWLVNGASGLAKRLHVPDLVIGLTVVAFGTSAPELMVNLMAAFNNESEIALTNILGSNSINTFVILGVSALIYPIKSQKCSRQYEIPWSFFAGLVIVLMGTECFGLCGNEFVISRLDGIVLLLIFSLFMYYTLNMAKHNKDAQEDGFLPMKIWKAFLLIGIGMVALVIGGELIVSNAVSIAQAFGVSQAVIGVTVVALGTSLPELATSAMAALKKNPDLAIGNVIGSNIFNVFFVLGISAVIRPLPSYPNLWIDASLAAFGSGLLLLFVTTNRKKELKRWQGAFLLLCYTIYLMWLLSTL